MGDMVYVMIYYLSPGADIQLVYTDLADGLR